MLHPEGAAGPSQPALAGARSSCVGMDPGAIGNGMTELLPWEHSPLTQVMTPVKDPDNPNVLQGWLWETCRSSQEAPTQKAQRSGPAGVMSHGKPENLS